MRLAIMLFTRDLRLQDNPALDAAVGRAQAVVPLFVFDDRLIAGPLAAPSRVRFLLEALTDLRAALRERGGDLIIRRGDPVTEVIGLARDTEAEGVFCADDVSGYAASRRARLTAACQAARLGLTMCPGVTVVPPGELRPSGGGDHYRVFTPYLRAWERAARRPEAATPDQVRLPGGLTAGDLPDLAAARQGIGAFLGGETAGNQRLDAWLRSGGPGGYTDGRNDLAGDQTSRLSPYLHFGCLSPLRLARVAGPGEFTRQLAWRDFFHQVTAAFPAITTRDYRPGRGGGRGGGGGGGGDRDGPASTPDVTPVPGPDDPPGPSDHQAAQLAELLHALNITLAPIAKGRCDHRHREDRYTPSRKLKHLVRARTATCSAPGCGAQAIYCDLDHSVPYPDGITCECDLAPKCRRHHRCKQAPGWRLEQIEPGLMRWTGPSGRTYTTTPTVYEL
jgi:hypothetical protein